MKADRSSEDRSVGQLLISHPQKVSSRRWHRLRGEHFKRASRSLPALMALPEPLAAILGFMSDTKHVVLIHGTWCRGDSWVPTRAAFEERGYTVHTPTLRHHEVPLQEGAMKIAPLSMRDYTDDLVALVDSLDSPPLLVGLSLGGLLAQLVAARTRHAGVVAACPAPAAGILAATPTTLRVFGILFGRHYLQPRPWAKPLPPPTWDRFRRWIANAQTEEIAREVFAELVVCESGRAYCELVFPYLDRGKATTVNFAAVTTPVLAIGGEYDRLVPPQVARKTAERYQRGIYLEIPRSDHLVFFGEALAVTMGHIDDWIARNHVLASA
jgi:pimeloyl-ACP methyl ester carboxylesterase